MTQLRTDPLFPDLSVAQSAQAVPFLKWAGGKRKLVSAILRAAPPTFQRYVEPFLGGGAVALALGHQSMLLNDANAELMETFCVVRDELDALLALLDEHRDRHSMGYYYQVRAQDPATLLPVARAARFMYLNKTCFNGLYRVNRFGQFNVPFGRYANPILYDRDSMTAASRVLQQAELSAEDYASFLMRVAHPGDFIYLDPPYVPISVYSDFKRYTKEQFRADDQVRLAQVYDDLVALGAYPVLSNSYSDVALELYAKHHIDVVYVGRSINHDGAGRAPIREILVSPGRVA